MPVNPVEEFTDEGNNKWKFYAEIRYKHYKKEEILIRSTVTNESELKTLIGSSDTDTGNANEDDPCFRSWTRGNVNATNSNTSDSTVNTITNNALTEANTNTQLAPFFSKVLYN